VARHADGGGGGGGGGGGDRAAAVAAGDDAATTAAVEAAVAKPRAFFAACMAARGDERRRRWGLFGWRSHAGAPAPVDLAADDSPLARFAAPADALEAAPAGSDAPTVASFATAAAYFHRHDGGSPFLDLSIDVDARHPRVYGLYVSQGGLGLPHRDYYLVDDETHTPVREAYVVLLETMAAAASTAGLLGGGKDGWGAFADAHDVAAAVLAVETRLANLTAPPEDLRDPEVWYNPKAVASMPVVSALLEGANLTAPAAPDDGAAVAAAAASARQAAEPGTEPDGDEAPGLAVPPRPPPGVAATPTVIVDVPPFFDGLAALLGDAVGPPANATARSALRAYVAVRATRHVAASGAAGASLYAALVALAKVSRGLRAPPPAWEACLGATSGAVGEALSAAYVAAHFPDAARAAATASAAAVRAAFGRMLDGADWMDGATRTEARAKLDGIHLKIGYKDDLDTYEALVVASPDGADAVPYPHAANTLAAAEYSWNKEVARLADGAPVDKTQWSMLPTDVNAYYDPTRNEVVTPAGILQSPFWSTDFPDALNFGGIGSVQGHEVRRCWREEGGGRAVGVGFWGVPAGVGVSHVLLSPSLGWRRRTALLQRSRVSTDSLLRCSDCAVHWFSGTVALSSWLLICRPTGIALWSSIPRWLPSGCAPSADFPRV